MKITNEEIEAKADTLGYHDPDMNRLYQEGFTDCAKWMREMSDEKSEQFWSDLSDKFYDSKIAHDYKDGKFDYREIRKWFLSQSEIPTDKNNK